MLITKLFDTALTLLCKLPFVWLQKIGHWAVLCLWYSQGRMARVTMENISLCFPTMTTAEQKLLARSSLVQTGKTSLETIYMWKASREACLGKIAGVVNEQAVSTAMDSGKGLIFIIPHLGNWELINHCKNKHHRWYLALASVKAIASEFTFTRYTIIKPKIPPLCLRK